ncbi:voltage-gated purine nucleotide uniporter SLC17A9 [Neoarius graeffei]|uniref:voltage-gated purine nucleotide uniporter SLC17A9 n=1 Tax=Neoarius graeffei TaxID=443677 RepID=UPI00298C403B|nr:voltage-gated purine nucleotide uniporter SLC17A9 [Neoarius graeffei]
MEQKLHNFTSHLDKNICEKRHVCKPKRTGVNETSGLWPRSLVQTWTLMLLLVTCLLYWARMAMPVCAVTMAKQFGWDKMESGLVLGVFFWGYCFTQVFGGHVSDKIGGERVLIISTSSWATMTVLTPLLVKMGFPPLITLTLSRFSMGVLQGVHYPSLNSIYAQRVAEGERGFLISTLGCGSYLGVLMVGGLGSVMLEWYSWESVFYVPGVLSMLWACCVWRWLPRGPIITSDSSWSNSGSASQATISRTFWCHLLKQPCVWAMIIALVCHNSVHFTLLSWLPTFFNETYPHAENWVFNVIPSLVALPSSLFGGCMSDHLIRKGFGTATIRKLMQFCSMGIGSVFIYLLCKATTFLHAVVFVSVAFGLSTFNSSGAAVNLHDLAPSCAGALFGIMNTCAAFTSVLMVYISGYLIEVTGSWLTVFSYLILVNFVGVAVFIIFGEAKPVDGVDQTPMTCI